jgi:hypothetical protein
MQKHDAVRARQTLSPPPLRRCLSVRQTTERILTKIEFIAKSCNRAVGFNFAATSYNSPLSGGAAGASRECYQRVFRHAAAATHDVRTNIPRKMK